MKLTTIATTLGLAAPAIALFLARNVEAHGGLIDPSPRAITTMGLSIESTFGHPIEMRASYTNGKGGNCLDFTPDKNLVALSSGQTKIKMRANDGANHIGPCTAYLVDPRDKSKKVQVGQLNDCMRSLHPGPGAKGDAPIAAEMTITVPSDVSTLPCDNGHCVLEWYWEATHLTPHELFNNCADVKISGASGGGSDPAPAPAPAPVPAPVPAPATARPSRSPTPTVSPAVTHPVPAPAPQPNPSQAPAPAAPTPAGTYVYIGSHLDKAGLTQWCNWNCPHFCPQDMCKLAN